MPRSEKQKQKLIRLLEIFMTRTDSRNGLSMPELISALGEYGINAERKSIYDDFLTLSELGFEVEKLDTRPPRYYISEPIFELAELKLLTDAVQSSKFITEERTRQLISKLKLFAGKNGAKELSRQVFVEGRAKTMNKSVIYAIDTIHSAINDRVMISFTYFDYDREKKQRLRHGGAPYTVSPLALIWDDEKYYLVAFDESAGAVKNYRVDKMLRVTLLDTQRSEVAEGSFDTAEYSKKIFGMYGGTEESVTLVCEESLAGAIVDRFGTEPGFIPTEGGFKVTVRVMVSPTFYGWVCGFGGRIRIASPGWVREDYVSSLRRQIAGYE